MLADHSADVIGQGQTLRTSGTSITRCLAAKVRLFVGTLGRAPQQAGLR